MGYGSEMHPGQGGAEGGAFESAGGTGEIEGAMGGGAMPAGNTMEVTDGTIVFVPNTNPTAAENAQAPPLGDAMLGTPTSTPSDMTPTPMPMQPSGY